jgi:hypothetical protein
VVAPQEDIMAAADSRALRFYRALLRVLPFDFRGDFGPEMETVFHEQHQEAERRGGVAGVLRLWWETIVGIFKTAPAEHVAMFRQDASFALRMMRKNPGVHAGDGPHAGAGNRRQLGDFQCGQRGPAETEHASLGMAEKPGPK